MQVSSCIRCQSPRILRTAISFGDCCNISIGNNEAEGYIKENIAIGKGDSLDFSYCLHCGQIQEEFPLPQLTLEKDLNKCDTCGADNLLPVGWQKKLYCKCCGAIQDISIDIQ